MRGLEPALARRNAERLPSLDRLREALDRMPAEIAQAEPIAEQPARRRGHHDAARLRDALQTSSQIGRVADYGLFLRRALPHEIADHDEAGRDADPHGELFARERPKARHRVGDFQARMDRPCGVVLVGVWETEIGENAVAHEFGDEAVISRDDARTSVLIGADDVTHVLGIELRRYRGRTD